MLKKKNKEIVVGSNNEGKLRSELVILKSEIQNKDLVNDSLNRVIQDLSLKKKELEELLSSDPINFSQEIDYTDNGSDGITRVVGIYEDPLVKSGDVIAGSAHDSQTRFQNDLLIDNLIV
mgnify:CR=1 FL=1